MKKEDFIKERDKLLAISEEGRLQFNDKTNSDELREEGRLQYQNALGKIAELADAYHSSIKPRGRNGGRKKSERELAVVTVRLYKDQLPITNEEIREAVDVFKANKRQA